MQSIKKRKASSMVLGGGGWLVVVVIEDGNTPVDSYKDNCHGRHNFSLYKIFRM